MMQGFYGAMCVDMRIGGSIYLDIQKRIFLISRFMNIKINYRHSTILIILSRIGRVHNILIYVEDSKTEDSAYYLYTLFP